MQYFHSSDIESMEQRFRTHLINSLSGFKPAVLVGTADASGRMNLAIFNSVLHIGAHPPLLGLLFRPHTVERHTLDNILATGVYTINHVSESFYKAAHQTSARYPKEVSEFDSCEIASGYFDNFSAPYVAQSPVSMGMVFKEKIDIPSNGTHLVIGEIVHLSVSAAVLEADGHLRLDNADIVAVNGLDTYYTTRLLEKLPYAKVV